jgi:hypothetical protein
MGAGSSAAAKAPPPSAAGSRAAGAKAVLRPSASTSASALEPSRSTSGRNAAGVRTGTNTGGSSAGSEVGSASSARSNKKSFSSDAPQLGAASTKYMVDLDEDGSSSRTKKFARGGSDIEATQLQAESARLQKLALEGDKPTWREMYREYTTDQAVNKPTKIEWSDTVPSKEKSSSSSSVAMLTPPNPTRSGSSKVTAESPTHPPAPTAAASSSARPRPDNIPNAGSNAQFHIAGPPPSKIAGPPPLSSSQTKRATSPGSGQASTALAPSVLLPMKAAIEGPPPGYDKSQQRPQNVNGPNDSASTVGMSTMMRTGGVTDSRGRPIMGTHQFSAPYTPISRPAPPLVDSQEDVEKTEGGANMPPHLGSNAVRLGSSSGARPANPAHPFPHGAHGKGSPTPPHQHGGQLPSFGGSIAGGANGSGRSLLDPSKTEAHEVKETSDVKRNRAQLPSKLTHAKPTTGDWLNKRYIVNNYILLDTLGTGSYGEVR